MTWGMCHLWSMVHLLFIACVSLFDTPKPISWGTVDRFTLAVLVVSCVSCPIWSGICIYVNGRRCRGLQCSMDRIRYSVSGAPLTSRVFVEWLHSALAHFGADPS